MSWSNSVSIYNLIINLFPQSEMKVYRACLRHTEQLLEMNPNNIYAYILQGN